MYILGPTQEEFVAALSILDQAYEVLSKQKEAVSAVEQFDKIVADAEVVLIKK